VFHASIPNSGRENGSRSGIRPSQDSSARRDGAK